MKTNSRKFKRMLRVRISPWNGVYLMGEEISFFMELRHRKNRFFKPNLVRRDQKRVLTRLVQKDIVREHFTDDMDVYYEIRSDLTWKNL